MMDSTRYSTYQNRLAKIINEYLDKKKMTKKELASRSGVTVETIRAFLRYEAKRISFDYVIRMLMAVGLTF